jgi:hypothetical protein
MYNDSEHTTKATSFQFEFLLYILPRVLTLSGHHLYKE